jgi:hypothetical protein
MQESKRKPVTGRFLRGLPIAIYGFLFSFYPDKVVVPISYIILSSKKRLPDGNLAMEGSMVNMDY